jgi:ArsR family transcriptional regulator
VLEQRQPYVSQQLASLREAGLVTDRRDGTLIYYRLANDHLATFLDLGKMVIKDLVGNHLVFAPVPEEALANCPCPRCQGDG